jgi:hypothetical protein
MQTDRTIPNNQPDIVIRDYENGTCMLIDVAIPGDSNVIQKETEEILKHKDLTIEIQHMWNVKTRVIPVMTGATGTISKSFTQYVSTVPGNHDVRELQKTAVLGTAHIRTSESIIIIIITDFNTFRNVESGYHELYRTPLTPNM